MRWSQHLGPPNSGLALDFAGEIQVSAIAELIKILHTGISHSVQPSCPQCCETMCHGKHTWLVHEETAGKVGTVSCSPNPPQPKWRVGKGVGSSEHLLVPNKPCWVVVFCGWESPTPVKAFFLLYVLQVPVWWGQFNLLGRAQGEEPFWEAVWKFMFLCVWAEVGFASGLEEERGLWWVQLLSQQKITVEQLMNNTLSLVLCFEMDLALKLS